MHIMLRKGGGYPEFSLPSSPVIQRQTCTTKYNIETIFTFFFAFFFRELYHVCTTKDSLFIMENVTKSSAKCNKNRPVQAGLSDIKNIIKAVITFLRS